MFVSDIEMQIKRKQKVFNSLFFHSVNWMNRVMVGKEMRVRKRRKTKNKKREEKNHHPKNYSLVIFNGNHCWFVQTFNIATKIKRENKKKITRNIIKLSTGASKNVCGGIKLRLQNGTFIIVSNIFHISGDTIIIFPFSLVRFDALFLLIQIHITTISGHFFLLFFFF